MKNIFFAIGLVIVQAGMSQQVNEVGIGQPAPGITFNYISNYKTSRANLADFKGKLVILDFWATGCSSCIAAFPKMEKLQNEFGDKIQVILVNTHEDDSTIRERMLKRKISFRFPNLPMVNGDSTLRGYFPYQMVPHHVWIDGNGIVKAITGGYNATPEHVSQVLNNETVHFAVKKDILDFDWGTGLVRPANAAFDSLIGFYSVIMKSCMGIGGGNGRRKVDGSDKINKKFFFNNSVLRLFAEAFGMDRIVLLENQIEGPNPFEYKNRVLLNTKDSAAFISPTDPNKIDQWVEENIYSYEIKVPPRAASILSKYMQDDLNRYFGAVTGITAKVEKRKMPCWILSLNQNNNLKTSGGERDSEETGKSFMLKNTPFSSLVISLNYYLQDNSFPVIDETGFKDNIDIKLNCNITDVNCLIKELAKYGLMLKKEKREIEMLVISDLPSN